MDLSLYAGRWVALNEAGEVAGLGRTPEAARHQGHQAQPKERLRLFWISTYSPHLPLPAWPFLPLKSFEAEARFWLVGGAVRDLLLGRPVHDWDFAVQGDAMRLARRVADRLGGAYVALDAERDTARVVLDDPTTRQPAMLDFAGLRGDTLDADLRWRDFTINAMAMTPDGRVLDPLGGRADLQARRVRALGETTFLQDPARLLRAVRIAGELDFDLDPRTMADIRRHAHRLPGVAGERIQMELMRTLDLTPAAVHVRRLDALGLLPLVLPELGPLHEVEQSSPHHHRTVWGHTLAALSALEGVLASIHGSSPPARALRDVRAPAWAWSALDAPLAPLQPELLTYVQTPLAVERSRASMLKWAALFHDVGKGETRTVDAEGRTHFYAHEEVSAEKARARLRALHFPNRAVDFVVTVVAGHMRLLGLMQAPPPSRRAVYRFYRATGGAGVGVVLFALADTLAVWGPGLERAYWQTFLTVAEALLEGYFHREKEVIAPAPLLTGYDLLDLGVPEGPEIGRLLSALREAQAAGEVHSREEALRFVHTHRAPNGVDDAP
ncbi:MAG: CCA tRNA nucleotidyltransferase [Anaerolineae bacterium]